MALLEELKGIKERLPLDKLNTLLPLNKTENRAAVRLPTKRSLNLVGGPKRQLNRKSVGIGLAVVLVAAILFGKFAVADRLAEVHRETAAAASLQAQLDQGYERIRTLEQIDEEYAHYTYSGMTDEELGRADRVMALELIERFVLPWADVPDWSIQGNQLTMNVVAGSLTEIGGIAKDLEKDPSVSFASVANAGTGLWEDVGKVSASVVVYLTNATGAGEEAEG